MKQCKRLKLAKAHQKNQISMFSEREELEITAPLFSGIPRTVTGAAFVTKPQAKQVAMFRREF